MTSSARWAGSGKTKSGPRTSIELLMSKVGGTGHSESSVLVSLRGVLVGTVEFMALWPGSLAFIGLLPLGNFLG